MSLVDDVATKIETAISEEMEATYPHLATHLAEYHAALVRAVAKVAADYLVHGPHDSRQG